MRTILALALLALPVSADEIYLKNGNKITGKATEMGDTVRVVRKGITLTLKKSDIHKIIYKKEEEEPAPPPPPKKAKPAPAKPPARGGIRGIVDMSTRAWPLGDFERLVPVPGNRYVILESPTGAQAVSTYDWTPTACRGEQLIPISGGTEAMVLRGGLVFRAKLDLGTFAGTQYAAGSRLVSILAPPNGEWVAAGSTAGEIVLWDRDNNNVPRKVVPKQFSRTWVLRWLGARSTFGSVDGALVARVWSAKNGSLVRSVDGVKEKFYAARLSGDGRKLVFAGTERLAVFDSGSLRNLRDGKITIMSGVRWRVDPTGKYVAAPVATEPVSPNRIRLISLTRMKETAVWPPENGEQLKIYDCTFSPDGKLLAVAAHDSGLYILSVPSLKVLHRVNPKRYMKRIAFSPTLDHLIAADSALPNGIGQPHLFELRK